jgi:hypothetical protein
MFFPLLLFIIVVLLIVGLIVFTQGAEDSKGSYIISGIGMILASIALIVWSVIAFQYPAEIDKEEFFHISTATYEDGIKIQTIKQGNRVTNVNEIFNGAIPENKVIKRTSYKGWYCGIHFPTNYRYDVVDKKE